MDTLKYQLEDYADYEEIGGDNENGFLSPADKNIVSSPSPESRSLYDLLEHFPMDDGNYVSLKLMSY